MKSPEFWPQTHMSRTVYIVVGLLVLAISAAPLLVVAKWIGRFPLTVELNIAPDIDASSITYVECWNEDEAKWLVQDRSGEVVGFQPPNTAAPETHTVWITCSGASGGFRLYDTYHHPEFVVVQYRNVNAEVDYARKWFAIPPGRGPRSITLTLP